jgi:hypothetical protein
MGEGGGQAAGRVPQVGEPVSVGRGKRITLQPERHRVDSPASLHRKRRSQGRTEGKQAGGRDPLGIGWLLFVVHTNP